MPEQGSEPNLEGLDRLIEGSIPDEAVGELLATLGPQRRRLGAERLGQSGVRFSDAWGLTRVERLAYRCGVIGALVALGQMSTVAGPHEEGRQFAIAECCIKQSAARELVYQAGRGPGLDESLGELMVHRTMVEVLSSVRGVVTDDQWHSFTALRSIVDAELDDAAGADAERELAGSRLFEGHGLEEIEEP